MITLIEDAQINRMLIKEKLHHMEIALENIANDIANINKII
jgi:hypothetical protein